MGAVSMRQAAIMSERTGAFIVIAEHQAQRQPRVLTEPQHVRSAAVPV